MYRFLNIDIASFENKDELTKGKETVKMDKKEFVDEHKHLVDVLNSDSKEDDKKEAKDQERELEEELKKAKDDPKVSKVMKEFGEGKLKSSSGEKVTNRKQAIAIAMNEAGLSKGEENDLEKAEGSDKKEIKKSMDMEINAQTISNLDLIKSHIGYQFANSENLKVVKKGSEIKEKLSAIKAKEETEISGYISKLEALKSLIPTLPTEEVDEYVSDGIDTGNKLLKFPWNETYCNEVKQESVVLSATETKPTKSEAQILCENKSEYNRTVEKAVRCQAEVALINTMLKNFNDSTSYNLSVRQASILGF